MVLTQAKTDQLTQPQLAKIIVNTLRVNSRLYAAIPFLRITAGTYDFNVETSESESQFRAVGEGYTGSDEDYERKSVPLRLMIEEAKVDTFQADTSDPSVDLLGLRVAAKTKAMKRKFEKTFINGNSTTNSREFDGLYRLVAAAQTFERTPETADNTIIDDLELAISSVSGDANAIFVNKKTAVKIAKHARKQLYVNTTNEVGVPINTYAGVAIIEFENDAIKDDEFFVARLEIENGLFGIEHSKGLHTTPLGEFNNEPQKGTRIQWYTSITLADSKALALCKTATV